MSIDIEKLKALALAATPDNSWPFNVNVFRKHLTPATVLELIAEVERLREAAHPSPIPAQTGAESGGREGGLLVMAKTAETRMDAGSKGGLMVGVNSVEVGGCDKCGIKGLHACLGHPMEPWTEQEKAELRSVLDKYSPAKAITYEGEASAGDGLTVEQAINDAYPVACASIGEVEDRTIELRGFRKGFAAALASHTKAGQAGEEGS